MSIRPDAPSSSGGPRILVLAPPLDRSGGIQQVAKDLLAVLTAGQVRLRTLEYRPGKPAALAQLLFDLRALLAIVTSRPSLVLVLNARYAPIAVAACRLLRRRYVVVAHGREVWGPLPRFRRHVLPGATAVWCVSSFTTARIREVHGLVEERLRPLVLGVEVPDVLAARRETAEPTALFVGRLERAVAYKGVDVLLAAWPTVTDAVPAARLRVVGDGDNRAALAESAPGGVEFLGRVSDDELAELRASSWVSCFPTRVQLEGEPQGEGLGLVALEAMASGMPLVASSVGGLSDIVDPSWVRIVDHADPRDVAAGVIELLQDGATREGLRNNAFAFVSRERNRAAFSRSVADLLGELGLADVVPSPR